MISRSHLASRWRILPPDCIHQVTLYERFPDSVYDATKPIAVGAAERRPVTSKDESFFEGVSGNTRRRMWHLWTETFTACWDVNFDPWEIEVESDWILKEENGNEWLLARCEAGLLESHWKCGAMLSYGEPMVE